MKASEIRQKTDEEIAQQLTECRAEIFKLRMEQVIRWTQRKNYTPCPER